MSNASKAKKQNQFAETDYTFISLDLKSNCWIIWYLYV